MTVPKRQCVLWLEGESKPVDIRFTRPNESSDGGAVLLRAADDRLGLTKRLAACVEDARQSAKVLHSTVELMRERVFAIACGYPDCNDSRQLRVDPVMKLLCGRSPGDPQDLASQATLSRFENAPRRRELLGMAYELTRCVIDEQRRRRRRNKPKLITIDMDPTEDPTYGDQQLTFFNGYYDNWCYLPMVTSIQFDAEAEQFVVAPVLRPGNAVSSVGAVGILKRLLPQLHEKFPGARNRVRMDAGFASPQVFDWLEKNKLEYLVAMQGNSVLLRLAAPYLREAKKLSKASGKSEKVFAEAMYRAGKWQAERRVIIKAEVVVHEGREPRDNCRFVITNMNWTPANCYAEYARRGDVENRFKELHYDLAFDRTSCTSFLANQFRNLMTAAAYGLYQCLRTAAQATDCARAQVSTLRLRLIKIGVAVIESARRMLFNGPLSFPWFETWRAVAAALARPS